MKKILLLFIMLIFIFPVYAEELPDITNDIEIRTKWYRKEEVGQYHPKGDDLLGYIENPDKIKYSETSGYSTSNCLLPTENYLVYKTKIYKYKYVSYTKYITLTNFEYNDNVAIFYEGKQQKYDIISNDNNKIVLKLPQAFSTEYLLFFIDYEKPYNITLSFDEELQTIALSKDVNGKKVLIPDHTWLSENTYYRTSTSTTNIINNDLIIHMGSSDNCRYQRIYTYRYKINKVYYDDNYHHFVEGYLPDMSDIKVYYKGKELIKTVEVPVYEKVIEYVTKYQTIEVPKEIIKTVKVPVETIKTIEVCSTKESPNNKLCECPETNESSCPPSTITKVVSLEQIKEFVKMPKLIHFLILSFTPFAIIIIFLIIKKYVIRK